MTLRLSPSRTVEKARLYSSTERTVTWAAAAILARSSAPEARLAASASASPKASTTMHRPVPRSARSWALHRPGRSISSGTAVRRNSSMAASSRAGSASTRISRTPAPGAGRLRRAKIGTSKCSTVTVPLTSSVISLRGTWTACSLAAIASGDSQYEATTQVPSSALARTARPRLPRWLSTVGRTVVSR